MKRKAVITGLSLFVLLSAGWVLLAAKQQRKRIETTPAPSLRVEPAKEGDATGKTVAAARAFLATLDAAGRAKVSVPFDDEHKTRWSNFPVGMVPRNGVRWGDLSAAQRSAALTLLATALSKQGLQKVQEIVEGDEVLKATDSGVPPGGPPAGGPPGGAPPGGGGPPGGFRGGMGSPNFGRDNYYLAFLGTPSLTEPWLIQFGGHHLAINVTVVGKSNVLTPSLPAAQPAIYKLNGETVRPLGRENDKGFALVNSLDAAQRKQAILNYQVGDLVLGPGQDGKTIQPEGIKASALNAAQQQMLLELAREWVGILNDEAAAAKMAEVKANLPETWFAWSGPTTEGSASYFRIQGPTLLIEYSPQRSARQRPRPHTHPHHLPRPDQRLRRAAGEEMRRTLAWLLCALALQATAVAHVLDEYVQAAQIALAPEGVRVELRLTPGALVAERVYALVDVDGDGQISPSEEQAYARRVIEDVALEVDGRRAPLRLKGSEFPSRREMDEGVGAIRLELTADADLVTAGEHRVSLPQRPSARTRRLSGQRAGPEEKRNQARRAGA